MATSSERARLCLCLAEETLAADAELLDRHAASVDMAELRADTLAPAELGHLAEYAAARRLPTILTVRRVAEGGRWDGPESERAALLARALRGGAYAFVELEQGFDPASVRVALPETGVRVIRSHHDLGMPADLVSEVRSLGKAADEIPRLEVTPRGTADLAELLEAMATLRAAHAGPWILQGGGEHGLATRVLATKLGSWMTCCSAQRAGGAAGLVSLEDLTALYRFRRIAAPTEVHAVIGNPVAHSRSPRIHNAAIAELGLDAVYLPLLVDDIPAFFRVAARLGLKGVSVTVPHKLAVMRHLARREAAVDGVGACNTLVRGDDGWFGANTDVEGFLAPLRAAGAEPTRATRATVIGAGGAARAVVWALRSRGAGVLVLNRGVERAASLAAEMGCTHGGLGVEGARLAHGYRDLVVQTSTCGMEPRADCDPLPEYVFRGSELVYELVYQPPVTRLLARAREAGCRTIGGLEMLEAQARRQFELFTGHRFPTRASQSAT